VPSPRSRQDVVAPRASASRTRVKEAAPLSQSDYRALATFRYELRRFLAFSEHAARGANIEPQQHQLLLAVQGLPPGARPTIGAIAERLCVQHHTTVALVDKLEERGLLRRERSTEDRREVLLRLTSDGSTKLRLLSELHRDHLRDVGVDLVTALSAILGELRVRRARK
jgi:DNA-binding MarR family transcriptional regulator